MGPEKIQEGADQFTVWPKLYCIFSCKHDKPMVPVKSIGHRIQNSTYFTKIFVSIAVVNVAL